MQAFLRVLLADAALVCFATSRMRSVLSAVALLQGPLEVKSEADGAHGEQHGPGLRLLKLGTRQSLRTSEELEAAAPET